jgi:hypothetical protein
LQPLPVNLISPTSLSTAAELILYPAAGSSVAETAAAEVRSKQRDARQQ